MRKGAIVRAACSLGLLLASEAEARAQQLQLQTQTQAQTVPPPASSQSTSQSTPQAAPGEAPRAGTAEAPPSELKPPPSGPQPRVPPDVETRVASPAAPPPPPPSAVDKTIDAAVGLIRFYGTIKPTVIASVGALESFSQPNASAATAAGNPALANIPKDTRGTFQVAQSRIGVYVAEKSKARGQVEIDFVDFNKASPTVASLPRLRIAKAEWEPVDKLVLAFGQDWDLFGPMNPYGSNLVGANFLAGNTGFMRQQIKVVQNVNDKLEWGAAVGLQGVNATARDNGVELARVPTFAVRLAPILGKSRIGVAGILTELRLSPGAPTERRTGAYGGQIYADLDVCKMFHLKAEGYIGRNLGGIGALALAIPTAASGDLDEIGGFASGKAQFNERHAVYLTLGAAQILNSSRVVPSYAYAPPAAPGGPLGPAALAGSGSGMRFNMSARIGYEFRPLKPLAFLFEAFFYRSRHVLVPDDAARFDGMRNVPGLEIAALYTF